MAIGTLTAIGTILSTVLSAYGLYKQDAANQEASAKEEERYQDATAYTKKQNAQAIERQKEQTAYDRAQAERTWKWKEEERDYTRLADFHNGFMNMLDKEPVFLQNAYNIWRSREGTGVSNFGGTK